MFYRHPVKLQDFKDYNTNIGRTRINMQIYKILGTNLQKTLIL